MVIRIEDTSEVPVLEAQAQRYHQGGRTVYHMALRMGEFDDALPEEVDRDVVRDNRRFIPSHANAIADYLRENEAWVLGPVTLSVDPAYVEFHPYDGQDADQARLLGQLRIQPGGRAALKMLDGQHRRAAVRQLRGNAEEATDQAQIRDRLDQSFMPVALYEETDSKAIRQIFADMAQQKPMDRVTKAQFDQRDPFNHAATEVRERSVWLKKFVEMNRSSIFPASAWLLTFNQLSATIKSLEVGTFGRISKARQREADANIDEIVKRALYWTEEFLPSAREEYRDLNRKLEEFETEKRKRPRRGSLKRPSIDEVLSRGVPYIASRRSETVAYQPMMLRILAGCFHDWRLSGANPDYQQLARFIETVDFNPKQSEGLLFDAGFVDGTGQLLTRRQECQRAVDMLVEGGKAFDG